VDFTINNEVYWVLYNILALLLFVTFSTVVILLINKLKIKQVVKYYMIAGFIILALSLVVTFFGYSFITLFSYIEWMTKFLLPWLVLYWLVRAIKVLERRV